MSTFKVGQRVRFTGNATRSKCGDCGAFAGPHQINYLAEAGVVGVHMDHGDYLGCMPHELEPLVPPHEAGQYSYTELMDRLKAGEGVPA